MGRGKKEGKPGYIIKPWREKIKKEERVEDKCKQ
jgi:hypothetical protein